MQVILRDFINRKIKPILEEKLQSIFRISLEKAAKEQGLKSLADKLAEIVPDLTDQYSTFKVDSPYLETDVRNLHAFQISLVNEAILGLEKITVVDLGDSSGTHLQYIKRIFPSVASFKFVGVNSDPVAVKRIKRKGFDAICARVEELDGHNINADIFLCFELLEHLMDPCHLLHWLSSKTNAKYLIITVPYLKKSRIGLDYIRKRIKDNFYAENTHIFELNPTDWKLLMRFSGWEVKYERIYLQYPKRSLFRCIKFLWNIFDYEGFYGAILVKNNELPSKYRDW